MTFTHPHVKHADDRAHDNAIPLEELREIHALERDQQLVRA